ncbi:MAG: hypothetical protein CVV64_17695 [Candidatus Wallbacteria bacterium HGW-Wallbacteria-1]|jgi:hypothetical protein|uniref:Uncharacterized protein n=1 Tax=Candidatus Wallbacteria bacterium HGW-Wallbacteria-1 TaxID=2013854 RepID=A0A2N1PK12_9BACT|nr:MAG: hypothetical protein CVV64_17695 [Candidatus Wallbacteria bacterium HGW-Wallbacteria-1]
MTDAATKGNDAAMDCSGTKGNLKLVGSEEGFRLQGPDVQGQGSAQTDFNHLRTWVKAYNIHWARMAQSRRVLTLIARDGGERTEGKFYICLYSFTVLLFY